MTRGNEEEKTLRLIRLLREHPDWSFRRYAEELDLGEEAVKIVIFTLWKNRVEGEEEAVFRLNVDFSKNNRVSKK